MTSENQFPENGQDARSFAAKQEEQGEKEMRLAKFLAAAGIGSRRSCEEYILEGRVTINGAAVTAVGTCVSPETDEVCFEGKPVKLTSDKVYLMLNKPVGYTCSAKDIHAERLVYQLIPTERFGRLFTVGRLDRDSEGLLLLTNDGEFAQKLTHPSHQLYKRYYVECEGRFTTSIRRKLLDGMYDNGEFLQALNVEQVSVQYGVCKLIFTMGEGRKREVRRLCKDVGLAIRLLRRISVGQLQLDEKLKPGSWRIMSPRDCELALSPIEVPVQPRPAHPPRPYWMKDRPEEEGGRSFRTGRYSSRQGRDSDGEWEGRPTRRSDKSRRYDYDDYRPRDEYSDERSRASHPPRSRDDYGYSDERPRASHPPRSRDDYGYSDERPRASRAPRNRDDYGYADDRPRASRPPRSRDDYGYADDRPRASRPPRSRDDYSYSEDRPRASRPPRNRDDYADERPRASRPPKPRGSRGNSQEDKPSRPWWED